MGKDYRGRNHKIQNDHTRKYREKTTATPYDDVFRSLVEKCRKATILLINEMFRESGYLEEEYSGDEEVTLLANESYGRLETTDAEKRITDSRIRIFGKNGPRDFHLECQSTADQEILIRIFEYDMRMARDGGRMTGNSRLIVEMPCSAVLYLRSTRDTPLEMQVEIRTPRGNITYTVPVLRIHDYGVKAIVRRQLYFLIPFYSFTVSSRFQELNEDSEALENHLEELDQLLDFLLEAVEQGKLSSYEGREISDALQYIECFLVPEQYNNLKKEVTRYMGGKVIEFSADRILKQGVKQGQLEAARSLFTEGVPYEIIRKCIDAVITDEELHDLEKEATQVPLQG